MADLPSDAKRDTGDYTSVRPVRESATSTPRWVKVFGIIFIILILLVIIMHLAGIGFGGHGGGHTPPASVIKVGVQPL